MNQCNGVLRANYPIVGSKYNHKVCSLAKVMYALDENNVMKQEVMETDTLYWDQKTEKIYTHCYVKMYSPDGFMQGYGMESDQRARNSIIYNPFNSYGILEQEEPVLLDSVNFIGPLLKK
jgi:hypothetical protein